MSATERSTLILTDEPPRVERFLAPLRRANFTLVRAEHAWDAERELRDRAFDLVVVALPQLGVERLLRGLRDERCASRRAGVIVLGAGDELEPNDLAVGRLANRLLPGGCSPVEFQEALHDLSDVAPRVVIPDGVRLAVTLPSGSQLELWLENLSRSGMLLRALETLPVGSDFGFALELASEAEPIRGRARVVRHAGRNELGHWGVGARFLALGGEAPQRIEAMVDLSLSAAANEAAPPSPPAARMERRATVAAARPREPSGVDLSAAARSREEMTDLTPVLDELLERGLLRRLTVADWYVTGAELGLESLRAFSSILASIYENRPIGAAAERRLADLVEVRQQLIEFGLPEQDVATRVRIMLALRPALHRLIRELDVSGAPAAAEASGAPRQSGVVAHAVVEIRRLLGARRAMESLQVLLAELRRPRFLPGSGPRRTPRQILETYGPLAASLGFRLSEEQLRHRRGLQTTMQAVELEVESLRRRLEAIHRKAYSLRFRALASDDVDADLESPKLHQVLVDTLAAGAEYLARSYAAYRHALEVIDADPALIDRVERLATTILLAERGVDSPPPLAAAGPSSA